MRQYLHILTALFASTVAHTLTVAQDTTDYYNQIKNFNLGTIFSADSFWVEGWETDGQWIERPEPLGYIDTNYTRFYIHYSAATKNNVNPNEYEVIGRTRVKDNICDFKGAITVRKSRLYPSAEDEGIKEGYAICDVIIYEDSSQTGSGFIRGNMTTYFYLNKNGQPKYNSLMFIADGFSNNECVGTWTSYKTGKAKKCNWGDFRIPDSGDLDIGAGEFSPADKYLANGWQSYRDSFGKQFKPTDKWWLK